MKKLTPAHDETLTHSKDENPKWTDLPEELLSIIVENPSLSIVDRIRFASVCWPWRSATFRRFSLRKKPYLLLLNQNQYQTTTEYTKIGQYWSLLDLLTGLCHNIDPLPELLDDKLIIGSQFGYLTIFDKFTNPSLFNPLTRTQINLPPFTTLSKLVRPIRSSETSSITGYRYCLYKHVYATFSLPEFRRLHTIKKLILSFDPSNGAEFSALALFREDGRVAYTRRSDKKWKIVLPMTDNDEKHLDSFTDAVFHDGMFFLLSTRGSVFTCDLRCANVNCKLFAKRHENDFLARYLFVLAGVLMQVTKLYDNDWCYFPQRARLHVRRLDAETGSWVSVTNIGGQALVVNDEGCMLVSVADVPELSANHAYLMEYGLLYCYRPQPNGNKAWIMVPDVRFCRSLLSWITSPSRDPDAHRSAKRPVWFMPSAS